MQDRTGPHHHLPWDDVRLFLALYRSRTLSEAGRRLGVDGSTVSRRLGALEEALKATLFERGREGIVATEAAEHLQPVAEEIEHAVARFTGAVEAFEREVSGQVRIACPGDVAEILVAPLLPDLLRRFPHLSIDLIAGEGLVDMGRREADIALRTARPTVGDLVVTRLFSVGWIVAAAPSLARGLRPLRAWKDVPWVGCASKLAETTSGRWFSAVVGRVEPVVRTDSLTVQLACVASGTGVALLPERSIESSGLVPLKLSKSLRSSMPAWPQDDLFLVSHQALRRVPRVRAVWEFLLEQAAERE